MNPKKSKKEQRKELATLIQNYIESGGEVLHVSSGTSGNHDNTNLFHASAQPEPKPERTPLTDVVNSLEERKHKKGTSVQKTVKRPKKKLIVDDFGDPVRWVWEE